MTVRFSYCRLIRMGAGRTVWPTSSKARPPCDRMLASFSAALALSTVRQRDAAPAARVWSTRSRRKLGSSAAPGASTE